MKRVIASTLVLLFCGLAHGFYSKTGIEAKVRFNHWIQTQTGDAAKIRQLIAQQFTMAVGPLSKGQSAVDPIKIAGLKGDHHIKILSTKAKSGGFYTTYEYSGTVMVSYHFAGNLPIVIVRDPQRIAKQATVTGPNGEVKNPCTDKHHQDKPQSFWYWWDPARPGCQLRDGVEYDVVNAKLAYQVPTENSYPAFNRLFRGKDHDVIDVVLLNGANIPAEGTVSPTQTKDAFVYGFRSVSTWAPENGYQMVKQWGARDLQALCPSKRISDTFTLNEYQKEIRGVTLRVLLFWGSSRFDDHADAFHCLLNYGYSNASVVVYNGHSGAGANLNLGNLRSVSHLPMKPNPSIYQIYAFNGCSSYNYYNEAYFETKGTKNLDIITNGIAGSSRLFGEMDKVLLQSIEVFMKQGKQTSYKTLIDQMSSVAGVRDTLTAINGDEDN